MSHRSALSLLALVPLAACFGDGAGGGSSVDIPKPEAPQTAVAHCDAIEEMSTCVEYGDKATADADCNSFGGTVGEGACPTDGLTGTCAHDGKGRKYYSTGGMPSDAAYAERHCRNAMAGVFSN